MSGTAELSEGVAEIVRTRWSIYVRWCAIRERGGEIEATHSSERAALAELADLLADGWEARILEADEEAEYEKA